PGRAGWRPRAVHPVSRGAARRVPRRAEPGHGGCRARGSAANQRSRRRRHLARPRLRGTGWLGARAGFRGWRRAARDGEAPGAAAIEGAKQEMAQLADQAARYQEEGRREEAKAQVDQLKQVAARAAAAAPAQAQSFSNQAHQYDDEVQAISGRGSAMSKKV